MWYESVDDINTHLSDEEWGTVCRTFTLAPLPNGESIYVDDEGLFHVTDETFFFLHEGYPQPLAGNGLYVGPVDAEGRELYPKTPIEDVRKAITFMTADDARKWASSNL